MGFNSGFKGLRKELGSFSSVYFSWF